MTHSVAGVLNLYIVVPRVSHGPGRGDAPVPTIVSISAVSRAPVGAAAVHVLVSIYELSGQTYDQIIHCSIHTAAVLVLVTI